MKTPEFNLKRLYELLTYETPALVRVMQRELTDLGYTLLTDDENYIVGIPATYQDANHPRVCFVAHMDTVPRTGVNLELHNMRLTNKAGVLGADDRAGVFAITEILREARVLPIVIFTNYEETGGRGVKKLCADNVLEPYIPYINMFVEPDRKGHNEYVFYSDTIPKEIAKFAERFGYHKEHGSYSDVCDLTRKYKLPHVNLSVGYMWQHTRQEHLDLIDLKFTMRQMARMLVADVPRVVMTEAEINAPKSWTNTTSYSGEGTRYGAYNAGKTVDRRSYRRGHRGTYATLEEYLADRGPNAKGGTGNSGNSKSGETLETGQKEASGTRQIPLPEVGNSHHSKSPDDWTSGDWFNWDREIQSILSNDAQALDLDETRMPTGESEEEFERELELTAGNPSLRDVEIDGAFVSLNDYINGEQNEFVDQI